MKTFDLIVFDIDGTLTESKSPIDEEMAELVSQLTKKYKTAIISGAAFEQFKWQILDYFDDKKTNLENLFLLPVDGTVYCRYQGGWICDFDKPFSDKEREQIKFAFNNIFQATGFDEPNKIYGELVEDRGAQLNFSALGQDAPHELKKDWDPDGKKRQQMLEVLQRTLPDFALSIGGTTSIEITRAGIDKAYGLRKLMNLTGIAKEKILYFGDKFFEGGNDAPIKTLGVECRQVRNLAMTKAAVSELLEH